MGLAAFLSAPAGIDVSALSEDGSGPLEELEERPESARGGVKAATEVPRWRSARETCEATPGLKLTHSRLVSRPTEATEAHLGGGPPRALTNSRPLWTPGAAPARPKSRRANPTVPTA